jgi:hypothetical protein
MQIDIDHALRGLLVGILVALIIVYVFRPKQPYPMWILVPFEKPWILILLIAIIAFIYPWDSTVAILMTLLILGVGLDIKVFGQTYTKTSEPEEKGGYETTMEDGGVWDDDAMVAGPPLAEIDPPNYPLIHDTVGMVPGSPAAF